MNKKNRHGYYVYRMINGIVHDDYFSLRVDGKLLPRLERQVIKEKAYARDDQLAKKQEREQKKHHNLLIPHRPNTGTLVRGVTTRVVKKPKIKRSKTAKKINVKVWHVSTIKKDGKNVQKEFNPHEYVSQEEAWKDVVGFLCGIKGIRNTKPFIQRYIPL